MLELCQKLNIECAIGCDYRHLAAHYDMKSDDIDLISQKGNPTKEVLKWVGQKPQNTVAKFRAILVEMKRDDCVELIDKKYKCEVCLVHESSVSDEYLLLPQTLNWLNSLNNEKLLYFSRIKHFVMQF